MSIKELCRDDLINRNPGYTFTETITNDITLVEFKNGSSVVIASAQKPGVDDAYLLIRENLIGPLSILPCITTTERNALTATDTGRVIFNLTGNAQETYDGSSWLSSSGGSGSAETIQVSFADTGNLTAGSFMKFGEVSTTGTSSWVAPYDYNIVKISIGRADTDASDIEILVANVVGDTIATAAISVTSAVNASISEGEVLAVRNKSTGNVMSDVVVSLILERV